MDNNNSSDSDYNVEEYVRPRRVRHTANGDSADVLGNFDDTKRQEILDGTYEEKSVEYSSSDGEMTDDEATDAVENTEHGIASADSDASTAAEEQQIANEGEHTADEGNNTLSKNQLTALLRGASKTNRHVLYVTNLNFETGRTELESHFGSVGTVKSVRIPKKRRGGFAFVEMADLESYQRGFQLHNTTLQGRTIKVQFSEAGKRKSANKKNIIKQKNRKLAEMRNEQKTFTKSGKFYDKSLKKEKAKELLARKRWRKPVARGLKS